MAYTILEQEFDKLNNHAQLDRVTILADTAADIPQPSAKWAVGSICMVAATHTYKVLSNEREWV